MSDSFDLGCEDCNESLTVGQGRGDVPFCFFYGEAETMKNLRDFLWKHRRHHLNFDLSEYFWDKQPGGDSPD